MKRGQRGVYQDPRSCPNCKLEWHACLCGESEGRPLFLLCARCGGRYAEHTITDKDTLEEWRAQVALCASGGEFLPGLRVRVR